LDVAQVAQGTIADEPEVDEIRGDFRSRVQVLHFVPDERHFPPSQGLEDVRSHPGAVTEFDRVPIVPGSAIEEREQAVPAVVVVQERRELDHEGRDLRSQESGLRRVSRVEGAHPEVVRVADAPDAQVHGPPIEAEEDGSCAPEGDESGDVPLSRGMSPRGAAPHGRTRSSFTYRTPSPTSPKRICFFTPWARRTARLISGHAPPWPFGTTWTKYLAWCVSRSPS